MMIDAGVPGNLRSRYRDFWKFAGLACIGGRMFSSPVQLHKLGRRLLFGLILFLPGCQPPPTVKLIPVAGKVRFGNEPLKLGTVTFHPDAAKGNTAAGVAGSTIDSDGSYTLLYNGKPGAPPGWYKVSVSSRGMPKEMPPAGQPLPVPAPINPKFQDPAQSGITLEVVENPSPGAYDIKVTK